MDSLAQLKKQNNQIMKQNLRILFLFSFLLFAAQTTFAQEKDITGTVTSKTDGIPLPLETY
mgnify:FL=1